MATGEDLTTNFFPVTSSDSIERSIKKPYRITKKKIARKNQVPTYFRFGKIRFISFYYASTNKLSIYYLLV